MICIEKLGEALVNGIIVKVIVRIGPFDLGRIPRKDAISVLKGE